jgi:hypothetical protein
VLGRFAEPKAEVQQLIEKAADVTEKVILGEAPGS